MALALALAPTPPLPPCTEGTGCQVVGFPQTVNCPARPRPTRSAPSWRQRQLPFRWTDWLTSSHTPTPHQTPRGTASSRFQPWKPCAPANPLAITLHPPSLRCPISGLDVEPDFTKTVKGPQGGSPPGFLRKGRQHALPLETGPVPGHGDGPQRVSQQWECATHFSLTLGGLGLGPTWCR